MPLFTFFIPIASVLGSIFFIIYLNISLSSSLFNRAAIDVIEYCQLGMAGKRGAFSVFDEVDVLALTMIGGKGAK